MIHETKIHDHPFAANVERWVQIIKNWNDSEAKTFDMYYRVRYELDGVDVSSQFNQELKVWRTDNNRMMMQRDGNFQPIINPDYVPSEEGEPSNDDEQFLTAPAYDYTLSLLMDLALPNREIINMYVLEEAADGRFDV